MKIAGSTVQLRSQHAAATQREVRESLRMWTGDRRSAFESPDQPASPARLQADSVHLSHLVQGCHGTRTIGRAWPARRGSHLSGPCDQPVRAQGQPKRLVGSNP